MKRYSKFGSLLGKLHFGLGYSHPGHGTAHGATGTAPAAEPHPPPEKRALLSEFDKTEMSILMLDADSLTIVLEAVWSTGKVSSWSFVQVCRG